MATDTFPIASANDDGTGYRTDATTWASIASGAFTAESTTNIWVSKVATGGAGPFFLDNAFMRWDTSSIPDGAVITGATLTLYIVDVNDTDLTIEFAADFYDFGGEPSVAGDWEQTSSGDAIATIDPGALTDNTLAVLPLTGLAGINKTGYTGIRLAPKTTAQPTSSGDYLEIASFEAAQQEPRLEVTYSTSASQLMPPHRAVGGGLW